MTALMFNPIINMPTNPDTPTAFITLIAHEPEPELDKQLSAFFGDFIVISHSQAETATAFLDVKFKLFILDTKVIQPELIQELKSGYKRHFDTPLIALHGDIDLSERQVLIASGFDDCLSKPLTITKVDESINLWLNQSGLDSPLIAAHNLLSNFRYNRKLTTTLYSKIFEQLPQRLEAIDQALTASDYQTAYDIAHALDSEARICYLNAISESAKSLGQALKLNNHSTIQSAYQLLNENIRDFIGQRTHLSAFFDEIL
jgi:HPt (histidine-containing phosphotransfer) domain-containing protein